MVITIAASGNSENLHLAAGSTLATITGDADLREEFGIADRAVAYIGDEEAASNQELNNGDVVEFKTQASSKSL